MKLSGEVFTAFLKIMRIVGTSCNYLIIKDNKIRQLGDSKRNVFEIDLTPMFETADEKILNIVIPNVMQKYQLFDVINKQKCEIEILKVDKGYIIKDEHSHIFIPETNMQYVQQTNPFLDDENYKKRTGVGNNIDIITLQTIDRQIFERMNSFSKALATDVLAVKINKDKVDFILTMADSNSPTKVNLMQFESNGEIIGNAKFKLNPILACNAPMDVELYVSENKRYSTLKLVTTVFEGSGKSEVKFNLWNVSEFYTDESENPDLPKVETKKKKETKKIEPEQPVDESPPFDSDPVEEFTNKEDSIDSLFLDN